MSDTFPVSSGEDPCLVRATPSQKKLVLAYGDGTEIQTQPGGSFAPFTRTTIEQDARVSGYSARIVVVPA